ncbi:MAG: hypothetical protein ACK44D_07615 [Bacteroidia bacterium]|jgi:hypothetical protein
MKNGFNYFLLSALFFVAFLVVQFTTIYGNPGWFKFFALIIAVTFFISGMAQRKK